MPGRSSDVTGRKPILLLGLACASTSDLVFLNPHGVDLLLAGRVLAGLAAGIFTGTATTAIVCSPSHSEQRRSRCSSSPPPWRGWGRASPSAPVSRWSTSKHPPTDDPRWHRPSSR
ncbi:MFS transporter [Nocardioides sp. YIM B13467]|uniref:MFS transporter n=1 Tax=Nocardioides sp. YIM B13467 TaxID=3366294 RepID=UPI00366BC079